MAEPIKSEKRARQERQAQFLKSVYEIKKPESKVSQIIGWSQSKVSGALNWANFVAKVKDRKSTELRADRDSILSSDSVSVEVKSLAIFKDEVWNILDNDKKQIVLDIVGDIIELQSADFGGNPELVQERDKTVGTLIGSLKTAGEHIQSLSTLKSFGHQGLIGVLEQMDKGAIDGSPILVPSEEDLQIATILKMAGNDIEFNAEEGKWGSVKGAKPEFEVFNAENIGALCRYLNTPQHKRHDRVVPDKLLQVYMEVYATKLGANDKSKSGLEASRIAIAVTEQKKKFTVGSNEYNITRLLDNDTMLRNAQRMAMVDAFEVVVNTAGDTKAIMSTIDKTANSSTLPFYKKQFRHLGKLSSVLEGVYKSFDNATDFQGGYNENYVAQYDEQIRLLEAKSPDSQLLVQVRNAKEAFLKTVVLQQVFWQSKFQDMIKNGENAFGNNLAKALNESMGFAVMQNEGGFNMANGDAVKKFFEERGHSETFEELKAMLEKDVSQQEIVAYLRQKNLISENERGGAGASAAPRGANPSGASPAPFGGVSPGGTGQPQKNGRSSLKYPEIFLQYLNDIVGMDFEAESNLLLDYSNLRLYQFMWEKDGVFDIGFRALKAENPEATIDDFIKQFAEQQDSEANFNPELIEDAYYLTYKDGAEQSKLARAQSKLDAFNEQLLISDLMLGLFTPEELSHYNSLEAKEKTALLQVKNKGALKRLEELKKDPKAYEAALDLAKKRHEAGIVGLVIKQKWSNTRTAEQEAGVEPLVSTAIDKFISNLGQEQKANNQFLIENGEPIVVEGQPQQEPKQQEAKSGNTLGDTTFGDMYPSGPNVDQFLKRMKPYSAKAVKKNFIDKLLADLDKIKISKDAYYARMSSFTSSRDIFAQDTTEAEKKAIEAQLQQKEQEVLQIKQRDFEASAFIPAAIMFDRVRGGFKGKPEYESADKLSTVFRYLASTDDLSADAKLGVKTPDGKDVRDDLRALALKICGGGFKGKGAEGVQQELAPILTKYGVDPLVQEDIKDAFLFMTPELIAIALEPVSAVRDGKLEIGATIPEHMLNATNDSQRWQSLQVRGFNMAEHEATIEDLSTLVGTIYRTKDGSQIDKKDIDSSFEVKLKHKGSEYDGVEFDQVKDKDQMKAMLQKMRERANAAMQGGAPVAEDEGMGPND